LKILGFDRRDNSCGGYGDFLLPESSQLVNNDFLTAEDTRNRIIGTFLPILLLIAMTVLFAWGWSVESAKRKGFVLGFLILFGAGLLAKLLEVGLGWEAARSRN
jgi:hypothetical protein